MDQDKTGRSIAPDAYDSTAEPYRPEWPEGAPDPAETAVIKTDLPRRNPGEFAPAGQPTVRRFDPGTARVTWDQTPERPFHNAGPPPVQRVKGEQARGLLPLALIVGALAVLLVVMGIALRNSDKLPASVPVIGRDPGVDLCVAVAGGGSPTGSDTPEQMTEESYRQTRDKVQGIRNDSVRTGAVKIIDLAWQDRNGGLGLESMGSIGAAYADLTTGCADLGVSLPSLAELARVK